MSDSLLRPIKGGNAFEETVQRLLQTIRLGAVGPGDRLPSERELAVRLGVSRDTLREAISALADAGFLVSRRGRYGGTFVTDDLPEHAPGLYEVTDASAAAAPSRLSPDEIADALAVRAVLELGAVRLAAARALPAEDRQRLHSALEESAGAASVDYRRLDSRLHLTIAELAGAPSLVPLVADARTRVNLLLDEIPLLARNIAHSDQQHERIVRAILAGRADEAVAAMQEHLDGTAALLTGFLT
ncbi:FadR/GntR family transcriptional regulator [Gryllotalpicola ginsengisoli]|uniref:FadR/GntR family transcriptional regulator n=1 Tax=Gryllotalpicola ginsengisoli TaxID=444608 RepID=UPI0003B52DEA|nr:FCD domain-containing protein [Gryllotalpicola ginsengisoli]